MIGLPGARYTTVEGTRVELTEDGRGIVIWDQTGDGEEIVFAASPETKWSIEMVRTAVENAKAEGWSEVLTDGWRRWRMRKQNDEVASDDEVGSADEIASDTDVR